MPEDPSGPEDVLVIWNRYGSLEILADKWEAQGARVIVAENGYIGKDTDDRQFYALALHGHNGSGTWDVGVENRWAAHDIELAPWRLNGDHILFAPSRGIGPKWYAQPGGIKWNDVFLPEIQAATGREVRLRVHPGNQEAQRQAKPLEEDLENCWAVVLWGSTVGLKAILAGVPVFHVSPYFIAADAARRWGEFDLENPYTGPREPALHKMAWAQWSVKEIEDGLPFRHLLS